MSIQVLNIYKGEFLKFLHFCHFLICTFGHKGKTAMAKIFLIGMMGSGKSHISEKWAKKLKTRHYDLDHLIEILEDKTIAEIFQQKGEPYFRKLESEVLRWFNQKPDFVLATGGGTVCHNNNMEWMNKHGITVWLDQPIEILLGRLKSAKASRPLIANLADTDLRSFLEKQLEQRREFYSMAKYRLSEKDISNQGLELIMKENAN